MVMQGEGQFCNFLHGLKPTLLMVVTQFIGAGITIFYKLAANDGMSLRILVAYRCVLASAFMLPLAYFVEKNSRPKITWKLLCQAFFCGLFGASLLQNLYLESLVLTSASFAAAMTNLIPAITFILALCFRMEKLRISSLSGKAKVLGTLMGIGGAMILTFYKGKEIDISTRVHLLHRHVATPHVAVPTNRLLGSLFALCSCFSYSLWLILQTKMSQSYPCYSSTALMSIMAAIQAVVYSLCVDRDWTKWKLGWNIRLLTVFYTGVIGSGLMVTLMCWCVHMRGPLFVSIFSPLVLVLVALAGALLLDEKLYLGSILGGLLIVCGLYAVLWGKGQEMKKVTQLVPSATTTEQQHIIQVMPVHVIVEDSNNVPESD